MRIFVPVLGLVLFVSTGLSQITITSADVQSWFAPGKSVRSLEAWNLNLTMNIGAALSSAQTWTFPTVAYTDTTREDNFAPSATPYASRYPRATHARRWIFKSMNSTMTSYSYYRITADSMIFLGSGTRTQEQGIDTTTYDYTVRLYSLLPATYGKSTTRRDSIYITAGSYIIQRLTETFDAFGTIVVPAGSFQALRLKTKSISETMFGGMVLSRDSSTSFEWHTREGYSTMVGTPDRNPVSGLIPITALSYSSVITTPTAINEDAAELPLTTMLLQNYPNPFNPSTTIQFSLHVAGEVTLRVYDALGREVATLVDGMRQPGTYTVRWSGEGYPSGMYLLSLKAGGYQESRKMVLMK